MRGGEDRGGLWWFCGLSLHAVSSSIPLPIGPFVEESLDWKSVIVLGRSSQ